MASREEVHRFAICLTPIDSIFLSGSLIKKKMLLFIINNCYFNVDNFYTAVKYQLTDIKHE